MGRAAIQLALRQAGVGTDLSIALAADLDDGREAGRTVAEGGGRHQARWPGEAAAEVNDEADHEAEEYWGRPFLVADADVCGGFGDLCGRRVA